MSEATHPIDADGVNGTGNGNGNGNGSSNGVNGTNGINDNIISATNTNTVARPRARLGPTEIVTIPDDSDSEDGDEIADKDGEESVEGQADFLRSYPDDTEELQLQHIRLKSSSLLPLNFSRFGPTLKRLCLRQNELSSPIPTGVFGGLGSLEELDLYDNRLGPVVGDEELSGCGNVTSLDLSFNNIRHVPSLPSIRHLTVFYLVQNKISKINQGDLEWCKETITSLELGGNRIRTIEKLEMLTLLEELWLGKNKIRTLENLPFANLKILSLQSNRIIKIQGLEGLTNLGELYLSHNGLTKIEGLEQNTKLTTLDVGNNMIEEIENISHLSLLEEFWASGNQIATLQALDTQLAPLKHLETVYLEGNPCQKNDMAGYRRKIILALPQVKQIDATYVKLS